MKRIVALAILILFVLAGTVAAALADSTYVVQPGDTLYTIARRHGTTVAAVAHANQIVNPNLIYVGQALLIPDAAGAPPAPAPPAVGGSVVVQPGDTLMRIALRHGVTVAALAAANGISNPNLIYVGQSLVIPAGGAAPPAAPPPAAPPASPPAVPPSPADNANLLPNPSFEAGWHHQKGVPELQLPNRWFLTYVEGPNPFDPVPWSAFVRPETRVLSAAFLPSDEQELFIWDGDHTVKIFKGSGAISVQLLTDVMLNPGAYRFTIKVFPDLVSEYGPDGQKIWATGAASGEVRFIVDDGGSDWLLPVVGHRNTLDFTFAVRTQKPVRLGVALRGRYALPNNGWFLDDWRLERLP